MTYHIKIRFGRIMALVCMLQLLSGCGEPTNQSFESPVTVNPPPPPPVSIAPGTVIDVDSLTKGICADTAGNELLVDDVTVRDCNGSHELEVAGLIVRQEAAGTEFPGRINLISSAQLECKTFFEQQVGTAYFESASAMDLDTISPSANTWAEGDRTLICLVVGTDGLKLEKPASDY